MADSKTEGQRSHVARGGKARKATAGRKRGGNGGGPGKGGPAGTMLEQLSREELHHLLEQMLLGRRFEEKAAEAYALGKIGGFCHLYIGQEAVAVGAISALRPSDYVIAAYREHVQSITKGLAPREVMAELYGRSTGVSGGRGGSMHLYGKAHRFMGGWGIVGGQIPLAAGIGWAIKYREADDVCVCFMGEAAVNQGSFHESLNMVALWGLPVIYIVENNHFGMGTAWERVASLYDISRKSLAYDMPGEVVDGMDVLAVRHAVEQAAARARQDGVPTLIEARCYRFMGHSMSDPVAGVYRTREEVEEEKEGHDPIKLFIDELRTAGLLSDEELKAMDEAARARVQDAVDFAEQSPEPEPDALYAHVYAEDEARGRLFFDDRGEA